MIVITEFMNEDAVDTLRASFDVHYNPGLADAQDDIPALLSGAKALIVRNRTQVTPALLDAGPGLVCVGRLGVGLDNIDQAACAARGVTVYPATGANSLSVSEYVLTTAMMLLRHAYTRRDAMQAGGWPRASAGAGREISGRTLGLVGYGDIARLTAAKAQALGMEVIAHDPFVTGDWAPARPAELDRVFAEADVLSLHVPMTDATRHLANADRLALMRPGAVLINTARGGIVDEAALAAALRAGQLFGAALDVFEDEPLDAPGAARFDGIDNLILTPHIAGVTEESNARVSATIAARVASHLNDLNPEGRK